MLIAGNWKMNGARADAAVFIEELAAGLASGGQPNCDLLICPPFTLLDAMKGGLAGVNVALGAQDCHFAGAGAHTGDISAAMLAEAGCSHVIVGHSERRSDHGEDNATVKAKAEAALAAGLTAIVCVGETEEERDSGQALDVVEAQIRGSVPHDAGKLVIAYEPVWAIGTGRTPTAEDVAEVHGAMRALVRDLFGETAGAGVALLYGGSVKPGNAAELMAVENVDGALVGGASLKAGDFLGIAAAC